MKPAMYDRRSKCDLDLLLENAPWKKHFRIELQDERKLQRTWPPTPPLPILLIPVTLGLYPMWAIIFGKYREAEDSIVMLDWIATWVLDYSPVIAAKALALHLSTCLIFVGLCQLGIIGR
mmetsp:Transcript_21976/g.32458  ORF Transcript_21976/g.32458 Transcript_21976/m.32458 type:complete len:120 (+) Transcript_21976:162-521(+)|eukprot:CAMPEP_0194215816 /NCGR_PEP_ID=MMETSP0156-20130528/17873_1 /TAXON_ID=33649 /ORGANISM="Thalassionema nitzschioides, Strain L26-B" /LENGTH=119 /DNA_ID=CAMNT_0038944439 /DNA_START=83 /DNA_END=442 /DNA_ORIENTATION=-